MLDKLLTSYFCDAHNIHYDQPYKIEWINPNELITKERIDIIVKIKMLFNLSGEKNSQFYEEMYIKHIEAFSLGTFNEPGDSKKNSINDYIQEFNELYRDISQNGFDENKSVVPVGRNNVILNGAHRTAIAIFLGIKIPIIRFEYLYVDYSIDFFRKRKTNEKILNYIILEYLKYKKIFFAGCIWPRAYKNQRYFYSLLKELNLEHKLVTVSEHYLKFHSHFNLILEIYNHQSFLGEPENNFPGAFSKANLTYKQSNPITFFVIEDLEDSVILKLKDKFREVCSINKHSIHVTDNNDESLMLSKVFCNSNSMYMLSYYKLSRYPKALKLLRDFKFYLTQNQFELNDIIVTSSIILGLVGIRNPNDVDFFYFGNADIKLETHNEYSNYLEKSMDEIYSDPENHFYFLGLKFLTIQNIYTFKKNRKEKKDIYDFKELNNLISPNTSSKISFGYTKLNRILFYTKLRLKNYIIVVAIKVLKKIKLYFFVKWILKLIRKPK